MCQLQNWTLGLEYLIWVAGRTLETTNPYCCKKEEVLTKDSVISCLSHHHFGYLRIHVRKGYGYPEISASCRYLGAEVSCTFLWPWQHPQIPHRYHRVFTIAGDLAGNSKETAHSATPLTCKGSRMEDDSYSAYLCLLFMAWSGKKSVCSSVRLCTWLSGRYGLISELWNGEEVYHKNHENLNPVWRSQKPLKGNSGKAWNRSTCSAILPYCVLLTSDNQAVRRQI